MRDRINLTENIIPHCEHENTESNESIKHKSADSSVFLVPILLSFQMRTNAYIFIVMNESKYDCCFQCSHHVYILLLYVLSCLHCYHASITVSSASSAIYKLNLLVNKFLLEIYYARTSKTIYTCTSKNVGKIVLALA